MGLRWLWGSSPRERLGAAKSILMVFLSPPFSFRGHLPPLAFGHSAFSLRTLPHSAQQFQPGLPTCSPERQCGVLLPAECGSAQGHKNRSHRVETAPQHSCRPGPAGGPDGPREPLQSPLCAVFAPVLSLPWTTAPGLLYLPHKEMHMLRKYCALVGTRPLSLMPKQPLPSSPSQS